MIVYYYDFAKISKYYEHHQIVLINQMDYFAQVPLSNTAKFGLCCISRFLAITFPEKSLFLSHIL
ncbi:MAG: hypothetical protein K1000chlam3_01718 [Chlamydiae bacterium]|nr:hypothetical protein [Chlamydiota bacterium]